MPIRRTALPNTSQRYCVACRPVPLRQCTCPGCISALLRCLQACTFAKGKSLHAQVACQRYCAACRPKVPCPGCISALSSRTFAGLPAQVASQAQEGGTPSLSQPLTGSQGLHDYIAIGETVGQRSRGKTSAAAKRTVQRSGPHHF